MRPTPISRVLLASSQPSAPALWLRQAPYALFTLAVLALAWLA